jgi:hypothetical protein
MTSCRLAWRWQGQRVRLIDGTTLSMPDTPENQLAYPQQSSQKPGLGFPICRMVGIICLASGSIVNAAMGLYKGKGADGYFLLAELAHGVNAAFEQFGGRRKKTDFRKGDSLGQTDHLITYKKPIKKPDWMTEQYYRAGSELLNQLGYTVLISDYLRFFRLRSWLRQCTQNPIGIVLSVLDFDYLFDEKFYEGLEAVFWWPRKIIYRRYPCLCLSLKNRGRTGHPRKRQNPEQHRYLLKYLIENHMLIASKNFNEENLHFSAKVISRQILQGRGDWE